MAVKIIKPGNKINRTYYIKCSNCQCEFSCEQSDIVRLSDYFDYQDPRPIHQYGCRCPECGAEVVIKRD